MTMLVLRRWNKFFINLAAALACKKVIVSAAQAVRVFAADAGPRFINSASAFFKVEELADSFIDVIFLMAKHAVAESDLCVALLGLLVRECEVGRYCQQVWFRNLYSVIAATV